MRKTLGAAMAAPLMIAGPAWAENPFGFQFGMTKAAVEKGVAQFGLGSHRWLGATLLVQAQNHPQHSYMFNFCEDKLYEASQILPANFNQMANFVDASVRSYGQPIYVSAQGGMGQSGFVRPINLYWKIDASSYVRLMQLDGTYHIVYQSENSCKEVPT